MDIATKSTGDSFSASEQNQQTDESKNLISSTGITPSAADLFQVAKSISNYAAHGDFYTDSGTAGVYVLSVTGSKQAPTAYDTGMRARFVPGNDNTGASTGNVAGLGVKNIKTPAGNDPAGGDIPAGLEVTLVYDGTNLVIYDVATGGPVTGREIAKGADVASAAALPLLDDGNFNDVTGTIAITSFNAVRVGTEKTLQFDDVLVLTHDAADLILPFGQDIVTYAGLVLQFREYATGDWILSGGLTIKENYIHIREEQTSGTAGGTFTSGSWQTRVLNTEVSDIGNNATLASNQITLLKGTYRVKASAPASLINGHQTKLYNVTDAADIIIGTPENANAGDLSTQNRSFVNGRFTITATKVLELQHQCITTKATTGLGIGSSIDTEVYSEIEFWKEV